MAEQVSLDELRGKTLRVIVAEESTDELILEDEFGAEYSIESESIATAWGGISVLDVYRR